MKKNGRKKRLNIGLFISWLHDGFHYPILNSIAEKAAEDNHDLFIYVEGIPSTKPIGLSVYDLADLHKTDGLIIVPDLLYLINNKHKVEEFYSKYSSLPIITIGEPLGNMPAIALDNQAGSYKATQHLIREHGCKRLIYFTGPTDNIDSTLRLQGFKQALAEAGLPFSPRRIFQGEFRFHTAKNIIERILNENNLPFDAVVCANDNMALGVMEALSVNHIAVPEKIKVIGFDDIQDSQNINPPLTTVRQPVEKLARWAYEALLSRIRGEVVERNISVPAQLVIRQSCGCFSFATSKIWTRKSKEPPLQDSGTNSGIQQVMNELSLPEARKEILLQWLATFVHDLTRYLQDKISSEKLVSSFTLKLFRQLECPSIEQILFRFFRDLRRVFLDRYQEPGDSDKILILFQRLIIHLTDLTFRFRTENRHFIMESNPFNENLLYYHQNILSVYDNESLMNTLAELLPELYINSCYISEYSCNVPQHDGTVYTLPGESRSLMLLHEKKLIHPPGQGYTYPTRELLPREITLEGRQTLILLPLIFKDYSFGFIIIPLSACPPLTYHDLQITISRALVSVYNIAELKEAKALAESANKVKSEFLANMSHEIRTPLNSILGFTDILLEETDNPELLDKLQTVSKAGNNLVNIINDVLDFSKIEAGKMELFYRPFSLQRFFTHLKNMFTVAAANKNISFIIDIDTSVPEFIVGDEQRISQVLINLLGNAIKFTPHGRINLNCRYKNKNLLIRVEDTGIGIPGYKIRNIFSPFSQVDASTTRKYGGTGLGLAISRKLITKMGGDIQVESKLGKGSLFTVELPVSPAENHQAPLSLSYQTTATNPPAGKLKEAPFPVSEFRVLIAEDEEMNRKLMAALLAKLGVQYEFAEDGSKALQALRKKNYHLLLLDMQMPVMDGLEVLIKIRGDHKLARLYVIAVTAHALKGDEARYLAAGCNDYISKPVSKHIFREKIMHILTANTTKEHTSSSAEELSLEGPPQKPQLTDSQMAAVREILKKMKKCEKIFDEDTVREIADEIPNLGEDPFFSYCRRTLYRIAEKYETTALAQLIDELSSLVS